MAGCSPTPSARSGTRKSASGCWALCAVLGLFMPLAVAAGPDAIHILLSSDAPYYREAAAALRQAFTPMPPIIPLTTRSLDAEPELPGLSRLPGLGTNDNSWIVAIGAEAASLASREYPDHNLVAVLVSRSAWEHEQSQPRGRGLRAGVLIDQPVARALVLARLLRPDSRRAGTALGPTSSTLTTEFQAAAAAAGFTIDIVELALGDNPLTALKPLMGRIDVFVALPDDALFNRTLAKWILNLCFREHIPVIGFSAAYADAGAVAAVYSSPADIGRQSGELLARLVRESRAADVPAASWRAYDPERYALRTNPEVARALGIALPPPETLDQAYAEALKSAL